MRILSFFCGCGGLDLGFRNAGFQILWANDNAHSVKETYEYNFPETAFCDSNINTLSLNDIPDDAIGIIGGPPCQAYSVAGRVRDENGMRDDYRNYLFEHYCNVVNRYRPKLFVFENVPGLLSAIPDGTPITKLIRDGFSKIGYDIVDDLKKYAKVDASEFGVPQSRSRMIIIGIRRDCAKDTQEVLHKFYETILPKYKANKITVEEAIGDLPAILPSFDEADHKKKKAYSVPDCDVTWHVSRYHSIRDMKIFGMLADDIESGRCEYTDSATLSKLYEEQVGSKSPIHRYHVLKKDEPSTTIIAHLYKDGLMFIHPDVKQRRSITIREAAALQTFPDDFDFIGSDAYAFKMIGNAVPVEFASGIAKAVYTVLNKNEKK